MKQIISVFFLFSLAGCSSKASRSDNNPKKISEQRQMVRDQLSGEISLKADRHQLDDLRKDVPEEKKQANDELAFSLNQTDDLSQDPNRLREKFQNLVEKKRHHFNDKVEKIRKQYQKDETARRDAFMKDQNKQRSSFTAKKHPSDETHEFYGNLEKDRLEFFSKEREKRQDFDDEIYQQTRDFNDYMRSKNTEFNEQMRIYRQRYEAAKKEANPSVPSYDEENPKLPEPKDH